MGNDVEKSGLNNFMRTKGAIAGASAAGGAAFAGMACITNISIHKTVQKSIKRIEPMNSIFKEGAQKALDMYEIKHTDPSNPVRVLKDVLRDVIDEEPSKFQQNIDKIITPVNDKIQKIKEKLTFGFIQKHKKKKLVELFSSSMQGTNAYSRKDRIFVNLDKSAVETFHEVGHVLNYRSKGLGKVLLALRNPAIKKVGLGIAFASAILIPSKKDSEDELKQEQGAIAKIQRFLKKNCVGIAAISCMPVILEEGLASIKGAKVAKKVLSKDACKIVNRINCVNVLTYVATSLAITASVYTAKKIREFIDSKHSDKK